MKPKGPSASKSLEGKPSATSLDERLRKLSQDIEAETAEMQGADGVLPPPSGANANAYGKAARLASEFVAGILVGGFLGWAFDQLLGASPIGLIIFVFLGFGAGMMNMVRAGRKAMQEAENETTNG